MGKASDLAMNVALALSIDAADYGYRTDQKLDGINLGLKNARGKCIREKYKDTLEKEEAMKVKLTVEGATKTPHAPVSMNLSESEESDREVTDIDIGDDGM